MEDSILGLGAEVRIKKVWQSGKSENIDDVIPLEQLLVIFVNDAKISTLSCSPTSEIELAIGHIYTSGYLDNIDRIKTINLCDDDKGKMVREIKIYADIEIAKEKTNVFVASGCGNIDDLILEKKINKLRGKTKIDADTILSLGKRTLENQRFKKELGGLHSGVFFDNEGNIILQREDIGRHNCLDKIIGSCLLKDIDIGNGMIYTTGRVSLDVVLKLARAGVSILVTNSSVSEKAVGAAKKLDFILIGYSRGKRFNIYNDTGRIKNK